MRLNFNEREAFIILAALHLLQQQQAASNNNPITPDELSQLLKRIKDSIEVVWPDWVPRSTKTPIRDSCLTAELAERWEFISRG